MNPKIFIGIVLLPFSLSVGAQTSVSNDTIVKLSVSEVKQLIETSTKELRESNALLMQDIKNLKEELNGKVSFEDLEQLSQRLQEDITGLTQEFVEKKNEEYSKEVKSLIKSNTAEILSEVDQLLTQKNTALNDEIMEVISNMQTKILDQARDEFQHSREELTQSILEKIDSEIKALNQIVDNQKESIIKLEKKMQRVTLE
jgi:hypothetical protein